MFIKCTTHPQKSFEVSLKFTGTDSLATQTYQQIRYEFHIKQKLQCNKHGLK
jgi:hypothetical protein